MAVGNDYTDQRSERGRRIAISPSKVCGAAGSDDKTRRAVECLATIIGDNLAIINSLTNVSDKIHSFCETMEVSEESLLHECLKTSEQAPLPKLLDQSLLVKHNNHSRGGV